MKRIIFIAVGILVLALAGFLVSDLVFNTQFFAGEDSWICSNGEWVKHGNPSAPKPTEGCESPQEDISLNVYFVNDILDPGYTCQQVFAVTRTVPYTLSVGRVALQELLDGPTQAEQEQGYSTSINDGVIIQNLYIENGVAYVDFNEQLQFQVGGSCRIQLIILQITQTLKQFPTVNNVVISINRLTGEDILQP